MVSVIFILILFFCLLFFVFKQKPAYEMRISDWSSDVCSSDLERYRTPREPREVTFVNPHPVKGVDLAFEIVGLCPEIPFCFVEGWPMNAEERAALHARVAAHSNLRLQQRTHDMREVYRRTHTLLVPSQWEEAWGGSPTEAQLSGLPDPGSERAGLPEDGG